MRSQTYCALTVAKVWVKISSDIQTCTESNLSICIIEANIRDHPASLVSAHCDTEQNSWTIQIKCKSRVLSLSKCDSIKGWILGGDPAIRAASSEVAVRTIPARLPENLSRTSFCHLELKLLASLAVQIPPPSHSSQSNLLFFGLSINLSTAGVSHLNIQMYVNPLLASRISQ